MRKFIISIFKFSLPLIFLAIIYEIFLENLPTSYGTKKQLIENYKDSIEQVILGTSHVFSGINPNSFDKFTVNLSNNSQSLYYDTKILEKHLEQLAKLKIVIFEINFFSFYFDFDNSPDYWRAIFYEKYWGIVPQTVEQPWYNRFLIIHYPLSECWDLFKSSLDNKNIYLNKGWSPYYGEHSEISLEVGQKRYKQLKNKYMNEKIIGNNVLVFKNILNELTKRKISIFMVKLPVTNYLKESIEEENITTNDRIINSLRKNYPVFYLDYSTDIRLKDSVFADIDHLDSRGANLFSEILNRDLILHSVK